jgi:hypothetical protein
MCTAPTGCGRLAPMLPSEPWNLTWNSRVSADPVSAHGTRTGRSPGSHVVRRAAATAPRRRSPRGRRSMASQRSAGRLTRRTRVGGACPGDSSIAPDVPRGTAASGSRIGRRGTTSGQGLRPPTTFDVEPQSELGPYESPAVLAEVASTCELPAGTLRALLQSSPPPRQGDGLCRADVALIRSPAFPRYAIRSTWSLSPGGVCTRGAAQEGSERGS